MQKSQAATSVEHAKLDVLEKQAEAQRVLFTAVKEKSDRHTAAVKDLEAQILARSAELRELEN